MRETLVRRKIDLLSKPFERASRGCCDKVQQSAAKPRKNCPFRDPAKPNPEESTCCRIRSSPGGRRTRSSENRKSPDAGTRRTTGSPEQRASNAVRSVKGEPNEGNRSQLCTAAVGERPDIPAGGFGIGRWCDHARSDSPEKTSAIEDTRSTARSGNV